MPTRNIVPRANGEGAIGDNTAGNEKYWGGGYLLTLNNTDAIEMAKFNNTLQWKAETSYADGDIVFDSQLKAGLYLECSTGGVSGATKFIIPESVIPDRTRINDGSVVWIVHKIGSSSGSGIEVADVTNATITAGHARVMLTWTDPEDLVVEGVTLARWAGTLVVRKEGSAPTDKNDGVLVVDSTSRNAYASMPFVDNGLTDGVTYYYRFFPYTIGNTYTTGTVLDATPDRTAVAIPTTDSQFTYDGTYQTPVFTNYDSTKMSISGDIGATNAGDYATVFTLDEDYKWSDDTIAPKSVAWSIAKAAGSITLSKNSVSLDATTTSDTVTVSRLGDGAISVESSDTSVVTVSLSGDTITVTEVDEGNAIITVSVADGTNYLATSQTISVEVTFISSVLNDNSWAVIQQVTQAGEADNYWDVGDRKEVTLNGTVRARTLSNYKWYCYILGFNHNAATEGNNTIHFQFGFDALSGGVHTTMTDWISGYYGGGSGTRFCMNNDATNVGGWKSSLMRTTTIPEFKNCLPSDLKSVLKSVTKYTDNTGNKSNVAANVTATQDEIFLLAEYEIFGSNISANQYEYTDGKQAQYDYYKSGNPKVMYNDQSTENAVMWWVRSPANFNALCFCIVNLNGNPFSGNAGDYYANYSRGFAPGFCVG